MDEDSSSCVFWIKRKYLRLSSSSKLLSSGLIQQAASRTERTIHPRSLLWIMLALCLTFQIHLYCGSQARRYQALCLIHSGAKLKIFSHKSSEYFIGFDKCSATYCTNKFDEETSHFRVHPTKASHFTLGK